MMKDIREEFFRYKNNNNKNNKQMDVRSLLKRIPVIKKYFSFYFSMKTVRNLISVLRLSKGM